VNVLERIAARTFRDESGCHLWTGARHPDGHGKITIDRKTEWVHRVMYRMAVSADLRGLSVLHKCGIANCVNPEHLYLGDAFQNAADMVEHGTRISGELTPWSKVTNIQAEIIKRVVFDRGGKATLAAYLGVSRSAISQILRGAAWK
jgi:hypothetical protein